MKLNLKALGLALVAAFAMSVVSASAAQAFEGKTGQFTADAYPATITGHEEGGTLDNYFQFTSGAAQPPRRHCENVTYEATLSEASTTLDATPHYTNCVATIGGETKHTTVDLNTCYFRFHAGTKTQNGDVHIKTVEVVCPENQQIELTIWTGEKPGEGFHVCTIDIPPQSITTKEGEVIATNKHPYVTVDVNIEEKISYTETDANFFCPNTDKHHTADGSFVSNVTLTGFNDKGTEHYKTKDPDGTEWTKTKYLHSEEATTISVS